MTPEVFVSNLKVRAVDHVVQETLEVLLNPPGRKPNLSDKPVADWYAGLSVSDQEHAQRLAQLAAESVLFTVLVVLDNCAAISDGEPTELELISHDSVGSHRINSPNDPLHDMFNLIKNETR